MILFQKFQFTSLAESRSTEKLLKTFSFLFSCIDLQTVNNFSMS